MTFFDKSDRFKDKIEEDSKLGPGAYISHKSYNISQQYPPFGSTVKKTKPPKPEDKNEKIQELMEELRREEQEKIGRDEIRIVKQSNFGTNQKRFKPINEEEEAKPGPGEYPIAGFAEQLQMRKEVKEEVKRARERKLKQAEALKEINHKRVGAPSIPGREQKMGYTFYEGLAGFIR